MADLDGRSKRRTFGASVAIHQLGTSWLLLCQTVEGAQTHRQVRRWQSLDRAIGKVFGQDPDGLVVLRDTKTWHPNTVV